MNNSALPPVCNCVAPAHRASTGGFTFAGIRGYAPQFKHGVNRRLIANQVRPGKGQRGAGATPNPSTRHDTGPGD
jgi:hypothetical protein